MKQSGQEQGNPGAAAFTFADIADRLSAAGYGSHADALRRRAVQVYNVAGRYSDVAWLHTRIIAEAILAGRWTNVPGMLWVLHQLINEQTSHGETAGTGLTAVVSVLDAAASLFGDPMLLPEAPRQPSLRQWLSWTRCQQPYLQTPLTGLCFCYRLALPLSPSPNVRSRQKRSTDHSRGGCP
jgi:hypothetical protein